MKGKLRGYNDTCDRTEGGNTVEKDRGDRVEDGVYGNTTRKRVVLYAS